MSNSTENEASALAWFCIRSQPKHEHIAAAWLRKDAGVEVYLPRIRFRRATRRGKVWVTEALFPNYLFARFNWRQSLRQIQHGRGIQNIVHFGDRWPTIADEIIAELQRSLDQDEIHTIADQLQPGDEVRIVGGAFHGLQAVVTQPLSSKDRVMVLLDFLGRQTCVTVAVEKVIRDEDPRKQVS